MGRPRLDFQALLLSAAPGLLIAHPQASADPQTDRWKPLVDPQTDGNSLLTHRQSRYKWRFPLTITEYKKEDWLWRKGGAYEQSSVCLTRYLEKWIPTK